MRNLLLVVATILIFNISSAQSIDLDGYWEVIVKCDNSIRPSPIYYSFDSLDDDQPYLEYINSLRTDMIDIYSPNNEGSEFSLKNGILTIKLREFNTQSKREFERRYSVEIKNDDNLTLTQIDSNDCDELILYLKRLSLTETEEFEKKID